ncbi:hypothetical protein, partial [Klebsiella pneumoniae]|uniref:hypothetical protein n=1 Tax=Klebsiella pneumoniae TaxID=573 RepID=UPI00195399FE
DPFGNVFGIMRNPHYLAVLAGRTMTGERKSEVAMNAVRPTVARIWRGSTRPERADDYEAYLYAHGLGDLQEHSLG